jgi:hypothetical protein
MIVPVGQGSKRPPLNILFLRLFGTTLALIFLISGIRAVMAAPAADTSAKSHRSHSAQAKPAAPVPAGAHCQLLSRAQLRQLATEGGWRGRDIDIGVAVALAESGGNTCSRGDVSLQDNTWGPSIGLWQIRSFNNQIRTGSVRDELANYDPHINAKHAHQVWLDASRSWRPWSTWLHGTYLQYM